MIQFCILLVVILALLAALSAFVTLSIFKAAVSSSSNNKTKRKQLEDLHKERFALEQKFEEICNRDEYLVYSQKEAFLEEIIQLTKKYSSTSRSNEFLKLDELRDNVLAYNQSFIERRKKQYAPLFAKGKLRLDDEQQTAIITDDKHNLVVAGAGSGKTEVLTTRIAYLVKRAPDTVDPARILAIAFQKKAAEVVRERLKKRYKIQTKVKTFHALGKEILEVASESKGISPPVLKFSGNNPEAEQTRFIKKISEKLQEHGKFRSQWLEYMNCCSGEEERAEADFKTKEEYYRYMRELRYTALNGVRVKSEAERDILNFFLTHNFEGKLIRIEYESPAEWMKSGPGVRAPKPDFFFPDFGVYLEHWALDEEGNAPSWFEGDDPTEAYTKGMNYKKEKFLGQDKYSLIEMFSWENQKSGFYDKLQKRFLNAISKKDGFSPVPYADLVESTWEGYGSAVRGLDGNIARFIVIAKTYDLSPEKISNRLSSENWSKKQVAFARLALSVYEEYEKNLREENAIDFADMINLAIKELETSKELYANRFDHLLIDEYQDISAQRYLLVKALMDKNPNCKLFCVGDDWQSIMGFAGSNPDYFVDFGRYFDHPARTDLTKNYRSIKSIVDTGAHIISKNGKAQLKKRSEAADSRIKKVKIYFHLHRGEFKEQYYQQMVQHCIDQIDAHLKKGYLPKDIMILTRIMNYSSIRDKLIAYAQKKGIRLALDGPYSDGVRFMSVHKSKGLEAKVVFILNVVKDLYGFPCELEDPALFEPAILGQKRGKREEERRLFYVAMTRAKEDVHIYTQKCAESDFIKDIKELSESIELRY